MRRVCIVVIAIVLACSSTLFCQIAPRSAVPSIQPVPESQRASMDEVRALFESMGSKRQMEDMISAMQAQTFDTIQEQIKKMSPAPTPKQMREMRAWMDETMSTMNIGEMLDDMASIYQKYLTRDEVVAIKVFYSSPAGKSMLTKMPGIVAEYMQVALPKQMKKMEEAVATLQERMKKEMEAQNAPMRKN